MLEPVPLTGGFHFLDLPPELRKMVYGLLLIESDRKITMYTHKPVGQPRRPVRDSFRSNRRHKGLQWDKITGKWLASLPSTSGVLCINKQIYSETVPIAYGANKFEFSKVLDLEVFLTAIGRMRKYLRHVSLDDRHFLRSKVRSIMSQLLESKSLRSITFNHLMFCDRSTWSAWSRHRNTTTMESFVDLCQPFLVRAHKKRKKDDEAVDVQDLFQIKPSSKCYWCSASEQDGKERECFNLRCSDKPCREKDAHDAELATKVRTLLATAVGVKVKEV